MQFTGINCIPTQTHQNTELKQVSTFFYQNEIEQFRGPNSQASHLKLTKYNAWFETGFRFFRAHRGKKEEGKLCGRINNNRK